MILKGHVISAALEYFKMRDVDDELPPQVIGDLKQTSVKNRPHVFREIVSKVLKRVIQLPHNPGSTTTLNEQTDGIFCYAQEVLTYGLLYTEFEDAIKEGDGPRVIRCWKFFLPIFKASNRSKYALEAATLLINLQTIT